MNRDGSLRTEVAIAWAVIAGLAIGAVLGLLTAEWAWVPG